jgi:hypothetical protein
MLAPQTGRAKDFIHELPEGSRVMTAYISTGGLRVAQDFTTDRARAAESLRIITGSNLLACALPDEVRTFIRQADLSKRRAYAKNQNLFDDPVRTCMPGSSSHCGTEEGQ